MAKCWGNGALCHRYKQERDEMLALLRKMVEVNSAALAEFPEIIPLVAAIDEARKAAK